ncbi:hypothetical protein JQ582_41505 [Bradyrhizobium japonicum]|uniref:hypothetical protein n=1 Tax=Bradyrhizobium japonicum TaxID=375 RepID=UPI001BA7DF6F|nr:hypothetical protein [Bradyrhizobium japonicum]MBR0728637.1 hypothetical protein [Bradyrhizobium japonicum]MBR0750382.1 hypothetical protein [Bradyrhizobium japonicum]
MSDDGALKQETDALQQMTEAERKLLVGLKDFIEGKVALGVPRERAYAIVAGIFPYAREVRARELRRMFRVV